MATVYDFVIIGGGTAGLVVASRLSEDPNTSVLVLEAGADLTADPRVNIPIFYAALLGSDADWKFKSSPQPGLNGRVLGLNQGKALGGSSSLNAHVFVPPFKGVIDSWEALGNPGWNWTMLRDYFSKAYSSPTVTQDAKEGLAIEGWPELNEAKGPIQTSFGNEAHPIRKAWAELFRNNGQYNAGDPFIHSSVGSFSCLASIDSDGKRSNSTSAYYKPVELRQNLHVLTNSLVEKILFDESKPPRAIGVQYSHDGVSKTFQARKEVILAAGAFQSPKILQLSGVGGAELLEKHGIDIVMDLPGVGQNLQDHMISYTAFQAKPEIETKDSLVRQEPEAIAQAMQEYAATGSGPLASLGVYTYAYLSLPDPDRSALQALLSDDTPDNSQQHKATQAYYDIAKTTILDSKQPSAAYLAALGQTNYSKDLNDGTIPAASPGKFITLGVMLSQPLSRGSVYITSNNPETPPMIDPGYLSNPLDLEVIARHLLGVKNLAESPQLGELLEQPLKFRDPAADFQGDLDAAKKYARDNLVSMWHFVGTCSMLPREKDGVVDSSLKVYGIEGLRVVDASAIPLVSTANLQATVYAFAERAADLIKQDWKSE
ncbi:CAZyme family AA3 [Aspergillus niger]|uniref:GMC family oxidoreductase n=1 Tax=Aspergillus lacticoffeatus (strain CBS 101883) TaxID=1450533 RepID=UPI000D7F3979|nr:aryl-alcohol dehydrogenase [Aspergillus niger CBS 101883]KAI2973731.1 CAZyme family AA3 [Aspergillus niger]KAI3032356.1 CAZyme family AA3 [Aspergillus niger]KAI3077099.1 CAZyme family AA3 [Aspergillus niger]PYH60066.1 aryl-alcohol dehydrogenase [Aspergillus niger CBS 101883]GJP94205.1 aryl-alcohol dehydrogenase [Aspergillus niger]